MTVHATSIQGLLQPVIREKGVLWLFSFPLSKEQVNQKKLSKKKVIDGFSQEGDEVTQLGGREEGRGGQKIIFYFVLKKSYEESKPFLFETEETNHSSEVHRELVHSLSKR